MRTVPAALVLALTVLLGATAGVVAAQEEKTLGDDLTLSIGGRVWATTGSSSRSVGAAGISRLYELRWRGVDAIVPEVNVDLVWKRLVALGSVGGGIIDDGVLIDHDFFPANAQTRSHVEDSGLFYINTDVGARVFDWGVPNAASRGYLDALFGFQYWHERYVAFGATGIGAPSVAGGVKAIANDYNWLSLRVGGRTQLPIYRGLSVKLRGYVVAWSSLVIDDVHYLRPTLERNPSFRDSADGGIGGQVDGAVTYAITNQLAVELGFQYWKLTSAAGDETAFTTAGAGRQKLNEAKSERYGPFVGVRWRF